MVDIYEVGTFEKHEEGFSPFYKTLSKEKAESTLEIAKKLLSEIPALEVNASETEVDKYIDICSSIDQKFKQETGLNIALSAYSGGLYEIQMHKFKLH